MNYQSIAEIYAANDEIREKLKSIVENLSETETELRAEPGEDGSAGWTIREIVEHITLVENGMTRISAKLLEKAEAARSDGNTGDGDNAGRAEITAGFLERAQGMRKQRVKAPDRVVPTGNQTIAESLKKLEENRRLLAELRPRFERTAAPRDLTFPHPALGNLNANEWLALIGGHETRHLAQIQRILDKNSAAA